MGSLSFHETPIIFLLFGNRLTALIKNNFGKPKSSATRRSQIVNGMPWELPATGLAAMSNDNSRVMLATVNGMARLSKAKAKDFLQLPAAYLN